MLNPILVALCKRLVGKPREILGYENDGGVPTVGKAIGAAPELADLMAERLAYWQSNYGFIPSTKVSDGHPERIAGRAAADMVLAWSMGSASERANIEHLAHAVVKATTYKGE